MDYSKIEENGKRGQKATAKLFQMTDAEIKDWVKKYTELNYDFFEGTIVVERTIKNEIPECIKLWNYGCIEIGWFGILYESEHGRNRKSILNEEAFYALLGE